MQMEIAHDPSYASRLPPGPLYESPLWEKSNVAQPAQLFIETNGQFTSEQDKHIALQISGTLDSNLIEGRLSPQDHAAANMSLRALVPVVGAGGKRQIDGKTLPPAAEAAIASRLASPEIDIAGPQGSWGRLPEVVKKELTLHGTDMKLELSANCTVGCSFCALATKGPVSAKASFNATLDVMDDFMSRQDSYNHHPLGSFDSAYWGTDPFDLKWEASGDTPERDYTDLHNEYAHFGTPRSRYLYTSTAVPLGEEMRILRFGHKELYRNNPNYAPLRISRTHVNTSRVDHIAAVLDAVRPGNKLIINDTRKHIAIRGTKWEADKQVSLWDITGPNCRDGAIIGVHSVDGVMMQGASPERPSGELRQPIELPLKTGTRYIIPQHYVKPTLNRRGRLAGIYPDVTLTTIDFKNGVPALQEKRIANDPHRALLRVAGALIHLGTYASVLPEATAQDFFKQMFGDDVTTIENYIATGSDNRSMRSIIGLLAKKDYLAT